ncbi:Alpha/Beta hydrolase protein [Crepidotus variabilis]|uniref:acylaminoacyl-peptidase n=1 Tax=Crepidotus variabilis TaxID=179855 RepID=A0A9P6EJ85_9AGAR|nr:Alpha/Beta hydrolase protein [Crepidotus variabilis]
MYTQLAEIPAPAGAQFLTRHVVQVAYSVRDHERNTKRHMSKSIIFSLSDSSTTEEQFRSSVVQTRLEEDADIALQTISPSKQKKAVLRNVKKGSNTNRFVEVWSNTRREATLDVTDLHGDFYNDEFVSALSFSSSELALVYIAETKVPTDDASDKYAKYRYTPDFGEGLSGKRNPSMYLFRWSTSGASSTPSQKPTLHRINTPEYEKVRFGQAIFDPQTKRSSESQVIYATGYETTQNGRMLGIKFCPNRPTGIWRMVIRTPEPSSNEDDQSKESKSAAPSEIHATLIQKLTPPHISCRSPRIVTSSDRSTLVWLACATGGAHGATNSLHSLDITSSKQEAKLGEALLAASDTPLLGFAKANIQDKSNSRFPGLYPAQNLSATPSVNLETGNGKSAPFIITHSCWGSRTTVLAVSLNDGSVRDLTPLSSSEPPYSWVVLSTNSRDEIIVARSTPAIPYEILLGKVGVSQGNEENAGVNDVVVKWYTLDQPDLPEDVSAALSQITTKILPIEGREPVETVLIQSSKTEKPPCITAPHGGPHGTALTAFVPTLTALVLEGYTISQPNYTGSLGFGEAFVQGLIGRCGELDVDEVIDTARYLVKKGISQEGEGQQFIYGGSHGGFLGAHLIAKFPRYFSGAILRNPVISVGEVSTTDIPDWYFSEFGLDYPISSSPRPFDPAQKNSSTNPQITPESYSKLYASSPIAYVDKIEAPVLLLLGKEDRRVAPSHGIGLYHALQARSAANKKSPVEILIFESDSHPLESVEAGKVGFEASRDWLATRREGETK